MEDFSKLPNIGPTLADQLNLVGISSFDDFAELGSAATVIRMGQTDRRAFYNTLNALEGAIRGTCWQAIPETERIRLKAEFEDLVNSI
jgi:hypothetical protein